MRIIASLVLGFLLFFYVSELFKRIGQKYPALGVLHQTKYSLIGLACLIAGIILEIVNQPSALNSIINYFAIGSGVGIILHHLLSKHYLFSQKWELRFVKNHETGINRFLEALPGALTWIALTSPIWLSFTLPFAVAYLVILADVYWLLNALKIAVLIYLGYQRMEFAKSQNWLDKLRNQFPQDWENYYQLVVIPTYKEPVEVLKPAFEAVTHSKYPLKKIFLAVGFEEKDDPEKIQQSINYLKTLSPQLAGVFTTIHPYGLPGEVRGPATNRNWIINNAAKELKKISVDIKNVIVTTLDADFVIHPQFLTGAMYKYLSTPQPIRNKRSYTGVFLYYNNYWQTPTPMRLIAAGTAFWQLAEMVGSDKYMNFSSMSINMKSLMDVGLWIPDKVNDDAGFFWKAYFHFGGDYKVIPHFMPINADAVADKTFIKTVKNQYGQQKRWVYGAEHIPFVIRQYFKHDEIEFFEKTDRLIFALWGYVRWGMMSLFVTFAGLLIPIVNPGFSTSVVAYNLPVISSWFLTAAFLGMFATIYVHEKTAPPRPKDWPVFKKVWSYVQWILVPIIMVTISTIPAIDALTTLMLGKHLEFHTTVKVRTS